MALVQRTVNRFDFRIGGDGCQRFVPHLADDLLHDFRALRAFDHQRQASGGLAEFHGFLGVCVLRAVDDVGPLNQFFEIRRR